MSDIQTQEISKKRAVNLTVTQSLLDEARALNLNTSLAAERGIAEAVRKAKEDRWLEENQAAIEAHNRRIEERGPLLKPWWSKT
ncbi:MAG: type II toxin-antitoxin system CcdA family antitoxin [Rhodospirillales bacterium]|nr:type II toxin-antitoxin system CcdA family antitoxin [Rhodospirillales bacterium]